MTEGSSRSPYQPPNLETFPTAERYDQLQVIINKADADGILPPLPGTAQEAEREIQHSSRIRTIRTRLYLLNYLKRDNESGIPGPRFRKALSRFQRDAGLEPKGLWDTPTWQALQEIVSIEPPGNMEKWIKPGEAQVNPALTRAITLRLYAYGLLKHKSAKHRKKVDDALEKFTLIAGLLKLTDLPLKPDYSIETIGALFDQDNIAHRLSKAGDGFMMHRPPDMSMRKARNTVRKFVICCAKIELWLLGYDVKLDGKSRYAVPPGVGTGIGRYPPSRFPVYDALVKFWRDCGKTRKQALSAAQKITGAFFVTLVRVQQAGDTVTARESSDVLFEHLLRQKPRDQDKAWNFIKKIGSRIWDGIKRAWRWFKALIKRAVKKISHLIKNLARLAYQYALNAFPAIKELIKTLGVSVSYLTKKTFPGSDPDNIIIKRQTDCDFNLFINKNGDPTVIDQILQEFHARSSTFVVGMRIAGIMINGLITAVKTLAPITGWFAFILSLVKVYGNLKKIKRLLDENQAFLALV